MSRWGQSGLNFPGRILGQTANGGQKAPSAKEQADYDKQLTAMSSRLDRYVSQFEYHNSHIEVVYGSQGRTLKATDDLPSGTVLLQCTPAAQYICGPEDTAQGNIALGMQLLTSITDNGTNPSRMAVTTSSLLPPPKSSNNTKKGASKSVTPTPTSHPLKDCFPVAPERLYPSLEDLAHGEFQDPLLLPGQQSGKLTIPMPQGLTSTQQKSVMSFLQRPNGVNTLKRAVHIAQANSVLAHGQLSYILPLDASEDQKKTSSKITIRDNITDIRTIPCMEPVAPRMALFPTFSLLNHSCAPNCAPTFFLLPHPDSLKQLSTKLGSIPDDQAPAVAAQVQLAGSHSICVVVAVRALRPIKAGEELTINYTALAGIQGSEDLPWLTEFRNKHLKVTHGFVCTCKRCEFASGSAGEMGMPGCFASTVDVDAMIRGDTLNDLKLREALLTGCFEDSKKTLSSSRDQMLCAEDLNNDAVGFLKKLSQDPLWRILSKRQNFCDLGNSYVNRARTALQSRGIVDKSVPFVDYTDDLTMDRGCIVLKTDSTVSDNNTGINGDIMFSPDVTYTGTLASTNMYKVLLQAVKVYDRCSTLLIDMADDDDDETEPANANTNTDDADTDADAGDKPSTASAVNLVSTDAQGGHSTATGARVKQQLANAAQAKELVVVLEAVRGMAMEHVGDAHWVMMLVNVALGAAYAHAGMHALALYARMRMLLCATVMIRGEGDDFAIDENICKDNNVFGVKFNKLLKFTRSAVSTHPSVSAVGDSVLESAGKVLAMAYAEQARVHGEEGEGEDGKWIDVFVEELKALLVKHQQ